MRLPWLVVAWLLCQGAALAVAPATLSSRGLFGAPWAALCDCPDAEPGAACPMHSAPEHRTIDPDQCALQAACAPTDAAFLSLGMGAGITPPPLALASDEVSAPVTLLPVSPASRSELPDAPPPRA